MESINKRLLYLHCCNSFKKKEMKKIIFALLLFVFSVNINYAQEIITNNSILQMNQLGFDDSMIIDKINSSNVKFETSINELSKLQNAGVSTRMVLRFLI